METPQDENGTELSYNPSQMQISEAVRKDWSYTLSTVPDVIRILGECMILTSVPSAARVEISFGGNRSATLPTSLFQCNQRGRRAFIEAHTGMTKISIFAETVAPVVDKVINLMGKPNTKLNKDRLGIQLNLLKDAADTCAEQAFHIRAQFKDWSNFTEDLSAAVSGRQDEISNERMKQEAQIMLQNHQVDSAKRNAAHANDLFEKRKQEVSAANELRDQTEGIAAIALQASVVAGSAMPMAMPFATAAVLSLTAAAVVAANSSAGQAEAVAKMQELAVKEEQKKQQKLVDDMEILQHEKASLKDIKNVLFAALDRLKVLQQNVDNLLIYFTFIRTYVEVLMRHHYNPFMETLQLEGAMGTDEEAVELQEEDLRPIAKGLKERFITMQRISQVYSDVSEQYIIPGFNTVDKIGSSNSTLSEDEIRSKHTELENYRKNASENICNQTALRQKQLIDSIQAIENASSEGTTKKRLK